MRLPQTKTVSVRRTISTFLVLCAVAILVSDPLGLFRGSAKPATPPASAAVNNTESDQRYKIARGYGRLPMSFERNRGQLNRRVHFQARGLNYALFLTSDEAVFALRSDKSDETASGIDVFRMKLLGANRKAQVNGRDELPGKINYFIGNDPRQWRKQIPTYSQVHYRSVYPGIDLVYHGNQQQLEYDFVIAPRASAQRIKIAFDGVRKAVVDTDGNLLLSTTKGEIRQHKPIGYQQINGERREVSVSYKLDGKQIAFQTGVYDERYPLTIDPVLVYSTYLGGGSAEQALGVAVDAQGNAYLTGSTASADFPLADPFQNVKGFSLDAFVVKLNPAGNALVYSTYLGGNGDDVANAIAIDTQGNAYVVGNTGSGSFPIIVPAPQPSHDGLLDGFASKLSASGSTLLYSTFLAGENNDTANGVAVDASGRAYITGRTDSTRFGLLAPTSRHGSPLYKSTDSGGQWSPSSTDLTGSTVNAISLDPSNPNTVYAATNNGVFKSLDAGAHWTLTGTTRPSTAPTSATAAVVDPSDPNIVYVGGNGGLYKSTNGGGLYDLKNTGFLTPFVNALAIDPSAPATLYAVGVQGIYKTTNGGENWVPINNGLGGLIPVLKVVIDPVNPATVYIGTRLGGMFKTTNGGTFWTPINSGFNSFGPQITALAIDTVNPTTLYAGALFSSDGFLFKTTNGGSTWTASGTGLSIMVGGEPFLATVNALAVDPVNPATVYAGASPGGIFKSTDGGANWTRSTNGFPNSNGTAFAINPSNSAIVYAGTAVGGDAYAIRLDAAGSAFEYQATLGGDENDEGRGVALDASGNAYVVGSTSSPNFPTANAFQSSHGGFADAFVTKLNSTGTAFVYSTFLGGTFGEQGRAIAVQGGAAYVTGQTSSSDFPLFNPYKGLLTQFDSDVFVTKFNPAGSALTFSTYLGGSSSQEQGLGIAVGANGSAYVTGVTASFDFPILRAPQPERIGGSNEGFVTSFHPTGSSLVYSTYLGGTNSDQANAIAVDNSGNAYVVGTTSSSDFPVVHGVQPTLKGFTDAFITKLDLGADVQFAAASFTASEGAFFADINVTRSGDTSTAVSVSYATADASASKRSDYTPATGTLNFAAGETSKNFVVLLTDDTIVENTESVQLSLTDPLGALLGPQNNAVLNITDNDIPGAPNPISNSEFFVRQHYHDFLNREPDAGGLAFWVDQIESCGSDVGCREVRRINVSAAFFLAIEFQETGYFAYRVYKAAYGDTTSPNVPGTVPIIRFQEFLPDSQQIGFGVQVGIGDWEQKLEDNKNAYVLEFVQTLRFITAFPLSMTADQFVTKLDQNAGGVLSADEKAQLVAMLTTPSDSAQRGAVLRLVAEDSDLRQRELNRAFVLMQFYGYLRRNPDDPQDTDFRGWKFWLDKLNQFNGNFVDAEMVKSFLVSGEYRQRFGTP